MWLYKEPQQRPPPTFLFKHLHWINHFGFTFISLAYVIRTSDGRRFNRTKRNMKVIISALVISCIVALSMARPQEGAQFTDEAIRQAQQSYLIPQDAKIQKVERGIELASYESIPARQRIDLFSILGDQVPRDVIARLQPQVDNIGNE